MNAIVLEDIIGSVCLSASMFLLITLAYKMVLSVLRIYMNGVSVLSYILIIPVFVMFPWTFVVYLLSRLVLLFGKNDDSSCR